MYRNKWHKYRETHNFRVVCDICRKTYVYTDKCKHVKTEYHKVVAHCKKLLMDHNNFNQPRVDIKMLTNIINEPKNANE